MTSTLGPFDPDKPARQTSDTSFDLELDEPLALAPPVAVGSIDLAPLLRPDGDPTVIAADAGGDRRDPATVGGPCGIEGPPAPGRRHPAGRCPDSRQSVLMAPNPRGAER